MIKGTLSCIQLWEGAGLTMANGVNLGGLRDGVRCWCAGGTTDVRLEESINQS